MPVEIVVPALGESVVDATLARWLKKPGDFVAAGEPVVALETDKVDLDVSAERAGILSELRRAEGDTVVIGEVLATLEESTGGAKAGSTSATLPTPDQSAAAGESSPEQTASAEAAASSAEESVREAPSVPLAGPHATPLARSIAAKNEVDLGQVSGSGPGGRITKADVANYIERSAEAPVTAVKLAEQAREMPEAVAPVTPPSSAPAAAPEPRPIPAPPPPRPAAGEPAATFAPAPVGAREERRKMSRRRQTIAARLVEAQHTAAMLTTFNEVDMSAVMEVRKRRKESFKEQHGVGLGFMSFFTKAAVGALKAFPLMNAEIQGDEFVLKHYYDIGVAVSTDEGLVVPVLREADSKTFAQIESGIADLAARARSGQLTLPELRGGTFTITNGGVFGSLLSTPILNSPQVGILGMHKIQERAVVVNGEIVIRPMMFLALSYDHRIVDGAEAVRFLVKLKELIEDPEALLLEG
ncbi:MAG TPA: 2-oxoglutarate dehydrogenase complex dihydrolipoyllysine-residue succinyltransferase [Armatimonadota bacterium]|jgi:2-oxoglutarate dehydrogenase E2 component (dihydrolipoamide succinyltransferase)